jgi:AcrR family transcriptional regulator
MSAHAAPASARWTRRKEARPAEILEAALTVFAEKGFAAARMDDIARRAGVTKGTIYLYFPSKEDLFKSLVRESIGERIAEIAASVRSFEGPTADLIRLMLRGMGGFLLTSDRVVLPKIIIAEAGNFPELARFYREDVIDQGLGLATRIIERGIARGEFRRLPPEHLARIFVAPILLMAIWRTTFARFDAAPYDYDGFLDTHIDMLLRALAADGEHT